MSERMKDVHYKYGIPVHVTVEIDSREKYPVAFPAGIKIINPERRAERLRIDVSTRKIALPFGDYRLAQYPNCCVIERKGGQREIQKNIFNPRDAVRQAKSFRKLSTCEYPYLLIELSPHQFMRKTKHVPDTEALLHKFSIVMVKYGFNVLWFPWRGARRVGRRQLGTFLLHTMLACALNKTFDILPEVQEFDNANAEKKTN